MDRLVGIGRGSDGLSGSTATGRRNGRRGRLINRLTVLLLLVAVPLLLQLGLHCYDSLLQLRDALLDFEAGSTERGQRAARVQPKQSRVELGMKRQQVAHSGLQLTRNEAATMRQRSRPGHRGRRRRRRGRSDSSREWETSEV